MDILKAVASKAEVITNGYPADWAKHYPRFLDVQTGLASAVGHIERWFIARPWSFEVSTVVDDVHILVYSKIMWRQWPHYNLLSQRIKSLIDDREAGMSGGDLAHKYQTKPLKRQEEVSQRTFLRKGNKRSTSEGALSRTFQGPFQPRIHKDLTPVKQSSLSSTKTPVHHEKQSIQAALQAAV